MNLSEMNKHELVEHFEELRYEMSMYDKKYNYGRNPWGYTSDELRCLIKNVESELERLKNRDLNSFLQKDEGFSHDLSEHTHEDEGFNHD